MGKEKNRINIAFIGHAKSGKSTTIGHLMCMLDGNDKSVIESALEEAENKGSLKYASVLDKLKNERKRGYTIEIGLWNFETEKYYCTIIDAPGHRDLIENMITGTSQADLDVLIGDSTADSFEAGIAEDGQTFEHALLAYNLGAQQMICCCNKMDTEDRYKEIVQKVSSYLRTIKKEEIQFVPISCFEGDNMTEKSTNLDWYQGPTLVQAIDNILEPERPSCKPLRLRLMDVYKRCGISAVHVGRVESGVLKPGMQLMIGPTGLTTEVVSVQMHNAALEEAGPGDIVEFEVKNVGLKGFKHGFVASNSEVDPVKEATSFTARVFFVDNPIRVIENGYTPVLSFHTSYKKAISVTALVGIIFTKIESPLFNSKSFSSNT